MLIARDEFHSPEIESCKEGFNAEFFDSNNSRSMAEGLQRMTMQKEVGRLKRKEVSEWTASHYSFEAMLDAFVGAVDGE